MPNPLISILVPLYNEEEWIGALLERVLAAPLPEGVTREIVVVDDGSTDGSEKVVEEIAAKYPGTIRLLRQNRNRGKGAAIRKAVENARGEFCIIQDADLEYDPREYPHLLKPLLEGKADAVYGSRFMIVAERRVMYYWHAVANRFVTGLCNLVADVNLTDMGTGYKAFRTAVLAEMPIRSDRFGMEPEITIKLARRGARIYEVPVSYHGRTYEEGKKIRFHDAVAIAITILRFAWTDDLYKDPGAQTLHALSAAPRFNRWMADTIRPHVGSRVLEIGCGIGNLTRALVRGRERYAATDINAEHLARLISRFPHRPNLEVRSCDLNSRDDFEPFEGAMDTVICLNVVEHIENDRGALANIFHALGKGGRAIILVPEGQSVFGTIDVALGHFRRYSEAELKGKMEEVGFQVEQIIRFNRISRPAWFVSGRILKRTRLGLHQMRLYDRMVWLWRRIDRLLPWRPTSIIAIARKP
ncbi:MAG TPA: glycosyltransferase [Bryobacteraceae bacterium]|nr:glycosyltransferase [Bryobacteraceae bacterium]